MRIAVCETSAAAAQRMCSWIEQYCRLYQVPAVLESFVSSAAISSYGGHFAIVFLCTGGSAGFYQARQLRERDPACKIILVDDTQEFAIRGMRLHCTDFILHFIIIPILHIGNIDHHIHFPGSVRHRLTRLLHLG